MRARGCRAGCSRRQRTRSLGALAAAFGVGLALGCAGPTDAVLPEGQLAERLAEAEAVRGLRLGAPVEARWIPAQRSSELLSAELDRAIAPEYAAGQERLAQALGMLPAGVGLREAILRLQSDAAVGFYSALGRRLYLVGDAMPFETLDASAEAVLIHELVHALQDANTRLLDVMLGLEGADDEAFAIGALLEGDATWAAFRWEEQRSGMPPLSPSALALDWSPEWAEAAHPEVPHWVRESFLRQYPTGYALAVRLVQAGGIAALDAALLDPPLSSEELLHTDRYMEVARRRPLAWFPEQLEELDAGCRVIASNVFGELGARAFAWQRGRDHAAAVELASDWDGDRAWLFACPQGERVAWLLQFDDAEAARRFEGGIAGEAAGLRVDAAGRRVLLSRGLDPAGRRMLLETLTPRRFRDLDAWLAAHPEVLARGRALRSHSKGATR